MPTPLSLIETCPSFAKKRTRTSIEPSRQYLYALLQRGASGQEDNQTESVQRSGTAAGTYEIKFMTILSISSSAR